MINFPSKMPAAELDGFWHGLQNYLRRKLAAVIPDGSRVAYLDYPVYRNVGDMLIYLGTENWFKRAALQVVGRWTIDNFSFQPLSRSVLIICNGGGNWGDMYRHQVFRERVISSYPANKIVVLPQSVHYDHRKNTHRTARAVAAHTNLHLFVRDGVSREFCREHFLGLSVHTAPDMATFLYPMFHEFNLPAWDSTAQRVLYLLRNDREAVQRLHLHELVGPSDREADWSDLVPFRLRFAQMVQVFTFLVQSYCPTQRFAESWRAYASATAGSAAEKMLQFGTVMTSRLHGHIMASLLGIPNMVLDNSYGKLSRYHKAWHRNLSLSAMHPIERAEVIGD